MRRQALSAMLVGAVVSACGGGAGDTRPGFVVRDSAGIRIIENADSAWTLASAWRVEAAPLLEIGSGLDGLAETEFGSIGNVVRLADGRIAVGETHAREVRLFGPDGGFLHVIGGPGSGPGEFEGPILLGVIRGDSLVVWDYSGYRNTVFTPDGAFGRTTNVPPSALEGLSGVYLTGWLDDGAFVVSNTVQSAEYPPGRNVVDAEFHLIDNSGAHQALLARLPSVLAENRGPGAGPVAFSPSAHVANDKDGLWHAFPVTYELRRIGRDGSERLVRRSWTPEAVPEVAKARYRQSMERRIGEHGELPRPIAELARAQVAELAFADTLPAFGRFVIALDGHIWVAPYQTAEQLESDDAERSAQSANGARPWSVFDPDGRWLGTVAMPEGLRVTEIGADYVLGVWTDELDIPYVRLHSVVKPTADPA